MPVFWVWFQKVEECVRGLCGGGGHVGLCCSESCARFQMEWFYLSCEQSPVMGLRGTNHGGLVGQASRARGQKANLG